MLARRFSALFLSALVLLAIGACKKAEPEPPPPPPPPPPAAEPPPPEPVRRPPEPPVQAEYVSPWSEDIVEANEEVHEKGLLGDVYFEFDKATLTDATRSQLGKNADFLKSQDGEDFVITIEGHCDERGTNDYNLALGDRRANSARDYLTSLGISGDRLKTISYGEERPQCEESNEDCWQLNRRAYFRVTDRM
ncbi:MAG: OmpA family protein [Acidobacteria bacterium]|nr:OmpA family protein [Acidobacteriota bacterium]MYJ24495.1 OmpA family protein [Holophagales bacterium]